MQIKIIQDTYIGGEPVFTGQIRTVDKSDGAELISHGRAILTEEKLSEPVVKKKG